MELPLLIGLLAMFGWGAADFIQAQAIRDIGTAQTMMLRNLFTLALSKSLGLFLVIQGDMNAPPLQVTIILCSSVI